MKNEFPLFVVYYFTRFQGFPVDIHGFFKSKKDAEKYIANESLEAVHIFHMFSKTQFSYTQNINESLTLSGETIKLLWGELKNIIDILKSEDPSSATNHTIQIIQAINRELAEQYIL